MFSPRTRFPLPPTASSRTSRCFRTERDGRIALTSDWPDLLRATPLAGRLALQTRHTGARLIGFTEALEFSPAHERDECLVRDSGGTLHCRFSSWAKAWGWLRSCDCCGSPGRIELHNSQDADFLHLCALPESDPLPWSEYLAAVAASGEAVYPEPTDHPSFVLPRLASAELRRPFQLDALVALLRAFGDEGLSLDYTLQTAEVAHQRSLVPANVTVYGAILGAGESRGCIQLAWPIAREFALTCDGGNPVLHVLNSDGSVLLSFSAAAQPLATLTWQHALRALFSVQAPVNP